MSKTYEALISEFGAETIKCSATAQYIILHNHALSKEIQVVKESQIEEKHKYEELEEELDSITKSRNTLQGYMKNQHEIMELMNTQHENTETAYFKNIGIMAFMNVFTFVATINTIYKPITDDILKIGLIVFISAVVLIGFGFVRELHKFYISDSDTRKKIEKQRKNNELVSTLIDNMW